MSFINKNHDSDSLTNKTYADKKNSFFASRGWYAAALTIIIWSVFQEIIMASTDIVDNLFVVGLNGGQVHGYDEYLKMIETSGWLGIEQDILNKIPGLSNYYGENIILSPGNLAATGISSSNQLYIIMFTMCSGFCYGCGVYSSQYYGSGDYEKLQQVTATKMWVLAAITGVFAIFAIPGITEPLVSFTTNYDADLSKAGVPPISDYTDVKQVKNLFHYIQNEGARLATEQGTSYYQIVAPSYLLLIVNEVAITTLRETKRALWSFWMALIALTFNCIGNVFLTDAQFAGLGIQGSAIATVIARILQTAFIVGLLSVKKFEFIPRFHSFAVPAKLLKKIGLKASPILVNEMLYAFGTVMMVKFRGEYSVEALNANAIYTTVTMAVFSPLYHGLNAGITAFVGNELGANNLERAQYNAKHLFRVAIIMALIFGLALVGLGSVIPAIWNPNAETNRIASGMLMVYGVGYIGIMISNSCYSILRSGGQTVAAFMMDGVFNWCVQIPIYAILIPLTSQLGGPLDLDIVWIFAISCSTEFIKAGFGIFFYTRKQWVINLTVDNKEVAKLRARVKGMFTKKTV